jgi:hypothetical protein
LDRQEISEIQELGHGWACYQRANLFRRFDLGRCDVSCSAIQGHRNKIRIWLRNTNQWSNVVVLVHLTTVLGNGKPGFSGDGGPASHLQ